MGRRECEGKPQSIRLKKKQNGLAGRLEEREKKQSILHSVPYLNNIFIL